MNNSDRMVESQLYSDGLFSFSVYVADADSLSLKGQLIRQGRRTLHSFVRAGEDFCDWRYPSCDSRAHCKVH